VIWGNAVQEITYSNFSQCQLVLGLPQFEEEEETTETETLNQEDAIEKLGQEPQLSVLFQNSTISESEVLLTARNVEFIQSRVNGTFFIDSSSVLFLDCEFLDVAPESFVLTGVSNLTLYASPFCIIDPPSPIVYCSSKSSLVGGNFNSSLVSDKCTRNTQPLPLNQLFRISNGFTTLCGLQTYEIFVANNQVGFQVNLTVPGNYVPPQLVPTISGTVALSCDSDAYQPQAIFEATPGSAGSLALSWTTTQNPSYPPLQPNTSYCLTISSSESALNPLPLYVFIGLLSHQVSLPESTLVATNPTLIGRQQMTFSYEINDEWGQVGGSNPYFQSTLLSPSLFSCSSFFLLLLSLHLHRGSFQILQFMSLMKMV
jgi:hypothetical protein